MQPVLAAAAPRPPGGPVFAGGPAQQHGMPSLSQPLQQQLHGPGMTAVGPGATSGMQQPYGLTPHAAPGPPGMGQGEACIMACFVKLVEGLGICSKSGAPGAPYQLQSEGFSDLSCKHVAVHAIVVGLAQVV